MTREEAIELLEDVIGCIEDNQGRDYDEAFCMAIKALSIEAMPIEEVWECVQPLKDKILDLEEKLVDVEAIVRCKDCKYRDEKCGMGEHRWCKILKMSTAPNDYCSYGEEKKDYREFNF